MTEKRVVGVRAYRRHLQAMYRQRPDSSHGEDYFNSGVRAALGALNMAAGVDMRTPCERITPRNMGGGFCGAHHAWLAQSSRWCDLAQTPWIWAEKPADRQPVTRAAC